MGGISNLTIEEFINEENDDLKNNFVGVFPSNFITHFIAFHQLIKEKRGSYSFMIMNTDRNNKKGTDWWSVLELHNRKTLFLFDSFGFEGLKRFRISNDKKLIDKILFDLKKFNKKDNKTYLILPKFSVEDYDKMSKEIKLRLTTATIDLFHMRNEFAKVHNIKKEVTLYLLDDHLQDLHSDTCGFSQLYFYTTFFIPTTNSQIINEDKLNKQTIKKLLNEIFTLNK